MTEATNHAEDGDAPLLTQWEEEQRKFQQTMLSFIDAAAQDESFLVHLGNAMRGSLLAGKPYPGTAPAGGATGEPTAETSLDEVLFSVRRMEGQVAELVMAIDELTRRTLPSADAVAGTTRA